jgi:arylformamidase
MPCWGAIHSEGLSMIRDISQILRSGLPAWPGDTPYAAETTWSHGLQCPVQVSAIHMSTHSGTHVDAPLHYDPEGAAIADVALDAYIGRARVIDARGWGPLIRAEHVAGHMQDAPKRILFRTYQRFPHDAWRSDFTATHPEAIAVLALHGVRLIGVDSPSLDPEDSKTLDAHQAARRADMCILEGLVLDEVAAGDYELIALPLRLAGLDGSPVRAVLRDLR